MLVAIDPAGVRTELDYEPFGAIATLRQLGSSVPRQTFIDKEKDGENGLGDFGVRKYEEETGRFMSVDPLWEKYAGWTPYQYAVDSPLLFYDATGSVVGYSDERAYDSFDKYAQQVAALDILRGESVAESVMLDSRTALFAFGNDNPNEIARVDAIIVEGSIVGLNIVVNEDLWSQLSDRERLEVIGEELRHAAEDFGPDGLETLERLQNETEAGVDYLHRTTEEIAKDYTRALLDAEVTLRNDIEEALGRVSKWWHPTIGGK